MAAGLGFKTFNTGDVLSAGDTNGYLMQGIWVFANATARDAAVTSPQEGNSCYLKDTDEIQVYSGSAWVVKSASGSAGGMTLLSTTTLSSTDTTVSSISQDYNELVVWVYGVTNATANGVLFGFPKNGTTYLDPWGIRPEEYNGAFIANTNGWRASASPRWSSDVTGTVRDRTNALNFWEMRIPNYASTTDNKGYQVIGGFYATTGNYVGWQNLGFINSNSAVNAISIQNSGGNFTAGTIKIYGVK